MAVANLRPLGVSATYGPNAMTARTNALNAAGISYLDTALRTGDGSQTSYWQDSPADAPQLGISIPSPHTARCNRSPRST